MKKRVAIISLIFLIAIGVLVSIWYRNGFIAEIHKDMKQTEMLASSLGFGFNKTTEVTIRVKSVIKYGDVSITLQDENRKIVHRFKTDCKEKEVLKLKAGSYTIHLDSDSCKGKFYITVR